MTARASAPLLAADPAVPQRDLLLDGKTMRDLLSAWLGPGGAVAIERCRPRRAKYQPGRSLRVLYEVVGEGATDLVALRTFAGGRSEEVYRQAAAGAVRCGRLRAVAHAAELGAVLFVFPNDRKLTGLRWLGGDRAGPVRARLISYAPEKAATARLVDRGGRTVAFAKAYADQQGECTRRIHDAVAGPAARAGLRLPRAIDYSPARRILACEAIEGRTLAKLRGAELEAGLRRLGGALGELHGLEPPREAPAFDRVQPPLLEHAAKIVGRLRPDCAAAAETLVDRLLEEGSPAGEPVCLHGDVHLKNAIAADGGIALVDLDQIAVGPAAADLGSILAALRYASLVGSVSAAEEDAYARALLAGYARVRRPPEPGALAWHLSAALLAERALRAITRLRAPGLRRLRAMLAEASATVCARPGVAA